MDVGRCSNSECGYQLKNKASKFCPMCGARQAIRPHIVVLARSSQPVSAARHASSLTSNQSVSGFRGGKSKSCSEGKGVDLEPIRASPPPPPVRDPASRQLEAANKKKQQALASLMKKEKAVFEAKQRAKAERQRHAVAKRSPAKAQLRVHSTSSVAPSALSSIGVPTLESQPCSQPIKSVVAALRLQPSVHSSPEARRVMEMERFVEQLECEVDRARSQLAAVVEQETVLKGHLATNEGVHKKSQDHQQAILQIGELQNALEQVQTEAKEHIASHDRLALDRDREKASDLRARLLDAENTATRLALEAAELVEGAERDAEALAQAQSKQLFHSVHHEAEILATKARQRSVLQAAAHSAERLASSRYAQAPEPAQDRELLSKLTAMDQRLDSRFKSLTSSLQSLKDRKTHLVRLRLEAKLSIKELKFQAMLAKRKADFESSAEENDKQVYSLEIQRADLGARRLTLSDLELDTGLCRIDSALKELKEQYGALRARVVELDGAAASRFEQACESARLHCQQKINRLEDDCSERLQSTEKLLLLLKSKIELAESQEGDSTGLGDAHSAWVSWCDQLAHEIFASSTELATESAKTGLDLLGPHYVRQQGIFHDRLRIERARAEQIALRRAALATTHESSVDAFKVMSVPQEATLAASFTSSDAPEGFPASTALEDSCISSVPGPGPHSHAAQDSSSVIAAASSGDELENPDSLEGEALTELHAVVVQLSEDVAETAKDLASCLDENPLGESVSSTRDYLDEIHRMLGENVFKLEAQMEMLSLQSPFSPLIAQQRSLIQFMERTAVSIDDCFALIETKQGRGQPKFARQAPARGDPFPARTALLPTSDRTDFLAEVKVGVVLHRVRGPQKPRAVESPIVASALQRVLDRRKALLGDPLDSSGGEEFSDDGWSE